VPQRKFKAPLILVLLACGILLSATINQGTADPDMSLIRLAPLDAPIFSVESRNSHLILRGTTTSRMHETRLLQLAVDHFGGVDAQTSFRPGVILVDSWESTVNRLLYTLAAMDSAEATMRDRSIEIRGVTSDARIFFSRLEFLREDLQTGFLVDADVVVVDSVVPFEEFKSKKMVEESGRSFEVEEDFCDWELTLDGIDTINNELKRIAKYT